MRKLFVLLLAMGLLLMPTLAYAQGGVTIDELDVQLWPEYDQPAMLVMYSFTLSKDTPLPADVSFRIPANATVNAVARANGSSMVTVPYETPQSAGSGVMVTFTVDDSAQYRIEYYQPLVKMNDQRDFTFEWVSAYDVKQFFVQFQQPPGAQNFASTPKFPNMDPAADGIVYHTLSQGAVAAGETFTIDLSYQKTNDDLTVSAMPVTVTGEEDAQRPFMLADSLPAILVGAGVLLIVGGLLYFFMSGRSAEPATRKRHAPRTAPTDGAVYCHECGQRAGANDKFCRSCGAKLRS